jgi:hypothetical protein
MVPEKDVEMLVLKALENIAKHMDSVATELIKEAGDRLTRAKKPKNEITPQGRDQLRREGHLLEGKAKGLTQIAIPILISAAEMIAKDEPKRYEKTPTIVLPNYLG